MTNHNYITIRVPSSFPASRRPVYAWPVADMTHKNKETSYPKLAKAVLNVIDRHPTSRILAHTVNYDLTGYLTEQIRKQSPHTLVLSYLRREDKEPTITRYLSSKDGQGTIFFAPSLERGIDLPGDKCSAIIICKVPYPSLGDKQISQRLYGTGSAGKLWYSCETIRAIVQMTGRGMRSAEDSCDSYILDQQFLDNIWRRNRHLIPEWWREAVNLKKDGF